MFCSQCGNQVSGEAKFCNKCSFELEQDGGEAIKGEVVSQENNIKESGLEKIKNVGWSILGLGFFGLMILIPILFILGSVWVANNVLPWLAPIMWFVLLLDVIIALPLAIPKKTRGYAGLALYISSYVFGLTLWFFGLLVTYFMWGFLAVFIGLVIAGVGVVPIAMLATLISGEWGLLGLLIFFTVITFGVRMLGLFMVESTERQY